MSGALKRSTRWKDLERTAARKLGGRRIVRQDFFESSPDVVVQDFNLLVECKSRQRHAFHAFMEQARKYCGPDETPALVTKSHGEHGEIISLPLDYYAAILDEVRHARLNTRIHQAEVEGDFEARNAAMREKLALRRARHEGT